MQLPPPTGDWGLWAKECREGGAGWAGDPTWGRVAQLRRGNQGVPSSAGEPLLRCCRRPEPGFSLPGLQLPRSQQDAFLGSRTERWFPLPLRDPDPLVAQGLLAQVPKILPCSWRGWRSRPGGSAQLSSIHPSSALFSGPPRTLATHAHPSLSHHTGFQGGSSPACPHPPRAKTAGTGLGVPAAARPPAQPRDF